MCKCANKVSKTTIVRVSLLALFFCLFNGLVYAVDVDTTFPRNNDGVVLINNGAAKTNTLTITLTLSKKGATGISEVRFCDNRFVWSAFEPYITTKTWTFAPGNDGYKFVYAQFRDGTGRRSSMYDGHIIIDTTPPVISNVRTANVSTTGISILWDTDDSATAQIEYGLTSAYGSKSAYVPSLVKSHSINLTGLKEYTLYHYRIYSKDDIANTAVSADYTFTTKDSIPPAGTIKINNNDPATNSTNVTLNISATDAGSGLDQMQFSNDNRNWSVPEAYAATKAWALAPGSGNRTVYAKFKDKSGNWSSPCSDAITLDTTLPTGSIKINNDAPKTNILTVTLNLTAADASGIAQMRFSNDNANWSAPEPYNTTKAWAITAAEGTKKVYVQYKDKAGNWSTSYFDTIELDTTGPGIANVRTDNITSTSAQILWDTDEAATGQVEFGPTEAYGSKSAYLAGLVKPHTINLAGLKQYTLYHYRVISKDSLGNQTISADRSLTTKDPTLPTGTIKINNDDAYASSATVNLNIIAADTGSGLDQMQFSLDNKAWFALEPYKAEKKMVLSGPDGTKTVYAKFTDKSGNVSKTCSDAIILDTTAPAGSFTIDKNAAKSTTGKVTLYFSLIDPTSGLSKMQFSNNNTDWTTWENYAASKAWTLSSGNGTKTVYARFQDKAGNISEVYNDTITLAVPGPAAPTIDKIITPTKQNIQTITGKKSADTTQIIVTCPTAAVGQVSFPAATTWIVTLAELQEGANVITVIANNLAGIPSLPATAAIVVDNSPPSKPLVTDDGNTSGVPTQFHAKWDSSDPQSGIAEYQYRITQDSTSGKTIVDWTSTGTKAELTRTGLSLVVGNIYYIAVKARNNIGMWSEIGYSDGIKITTDTTPPTGSIKINNGSAYANTVKVSLSLIAQDEAGGSGLDKMCFSSDNKTWSAAEIYATTKAWTLSSGDGQKTVYVKFSDKKANWSSVYSAGIILDTVLPKGSVVINNGDASTDNWDAVLKLSSADAGSGMNSGAQMKFSNDNVNWSNPENYASTKSWKLSSGFGARTVYAKFMDAAGNWSSAYSDSINVLNVPKERIYIYFNGKRIAMEENGKKYFFHSDHLGSTSVVTDDTGQQVKYLEYKPYGQTKVEEGSKTIKRKFTGKELDDSTGLYDYGARMYEAGLGRFISADTADPSPANPQSLNRYSYCLNNPLKYIDPTGHETVLEVGLMAGAVIVTGYYIINWTFEQIGRSIHNMPYINLNFKLPGFDRSANPSRAVESPSTVHLKYNPEGMSYAGMPNTGVMMATKTFRHYGYERDAEKFQEGLRPGSYATEAKGRPMSGETAYEKLGLEHHGELPDSYYKVKVDPKNTPVKGPRSVPGVKDGGKQYTFPKGTPKGSVTGPFKVE